MENLDIIARMPEKIQTKWASPENFKAEKGSGAKEKGGRKGSAWIELAPGEERILAEECNCSGTIRRFWATINYRIPVMLRGLRLKFFWDNCEKPAIDVPFGDFFGQGLGRCATFESAFFTNPEGRSFNCYIPMPFKTGMKITVKNETDIHLPMFFYDVDYTVGEKHGDDILYLHAFWNREKQTVMRKDYEFLPKVKGKGKFLGVNVGVIADTKTYLKSWWGEGECKIYLDGDDKYPTLSGTGTEDYIGTGWGQGQYAHRYQGCHITDHEKYQYAFYRYHILDPVYFYEDIRVTMQQIGCLDQDSRKIMLEKGQQLIVAGIGKEISNLDQKAPPLFEREDDWSSCAYFYLNSPLNKLPELLVLEKRTDGLIKMEIPE